MHFSFETAFHHWTAEAYLIFLTGALLVVASFCLYCRTLWQLLRAMAPAARRIKPWQVWLLLVPVLHVLAMLLGGDRLIRSLRAEAASRGLKDDVRPTYVAGIAMAAAAGLCYVPYLHIYGAFAFVVCWIMHWVQLAMWCGKLRCENRISACERMLYEHRPFSA